MNKDASKPAGGIERPSWSKTLSEVRKRAKLSQRALAGKIGASQTTIAAWETGQNEPSFSAMRRLSEVLEVPVSELFFGEDIKTGNSIGQFPGDKFAMDNAKTFKDYAAFGELFKTSLQLITETRLYHLFQVRDEGEENETFNIDLLNELLSNFYKMYLRTRDKMDEADALEKVRARMSETFHGWRFEIQKAMIADTTKDVDL